MNQLRIKNIENSVFDFKNYNISHNFSIECGENVEKSIDSPLLSPSSLFSQGFDTRLFTEEQNTSRRLFRRSIGAGMGL